jgi:hypothetical protein
MDIFVRNPQRLFFSLPEPEGARIVLPPSKGIARGGDGLEDAANDTRLEAGSLSTSSPMLSHSELVRGSRALAGTRDGPPLSADDAPTLLNFEIGGLAELLPRRFELECDEE